LAKGSQAVEALAGKIRAAAAKAARLRILVSVLRTAV
jgi:hypothetical protein